VLRDQKLANHKPLEPKDRETIALFASSTFARTKRWKDDGKQIWQDYLEMIENLPSEISMKIRATKEYQDVINVHKDQPMIFHLYQFINSTVPYLYRMNCAIYETQSKPGLITSDNPCFWIDPSIDGAKLPTTYFGVGSPTLNVMLPISPTQYISLKRRGADGYTDLGSQPNEVEIVDSLNRLTVQNCDEIIVVNSNIVRETWFEDT
jgi:hypothetical protein